MISHCRHGQVASERRNGCIFQISFAYLLLLGLSFLYSSKFLKTQLEVMSAETCTGEADITTSFAHRSENGASLVPHQIISIDGCDDVVRDLIEQNHNYRSYNPEIPAPMYNYAYYSSQGFGRVVEHTVTTCLFGYAMGRRACVVDMNSRDPYYTWRTFVTVGVYDWEVRGRIVQHMESIRGVVGKLQKQSLGTWEAVDLNTTYEDILPMTIQQGRNISCPSTNFEHCVWQWDGRNDDVKAKVLISPNWGTSWHAKIQMPKFLSAPKGNKCTNWDRLKSLVQNAMYQITPLAKHLHAERMQHIVKIRPNESYGTIHLRFEILKQTRSINSDLIRDISNGIGIFIASFQQVSKWWLITDKPEYANTLASNHMKLVHGYSENLTNVHSNLAGKKIFGHERMAPSILDWVAMQESKVSLVTKGAFGMTGARGGGKYLHPTENKRTLFKVFHNGFI